MSLKSRSPITTHVLDTSVGKAATGVAVTLFVKNGSTWDKLSERKTDPDGRVEDLLPSGTQANKGVYRLRFEVLSRFPAGFYPEIDITFVVTNPLEHYHVPLLLTPFGYSTYRGT